MALNQLLMIEIIKAIIYAAHISNGGNAQDAEINARAYGDRIHKRYEILVENPVET